MKKIGDYLHFYINAEIQIEYGYPDDKKIGILTGFRSAAGWEIWPHKDSWVRVPKGERVIPAIVRDDLVKPILRPLSSMTEEELIEQEMIIQPFVSTFEVDEKQRKNALDKIKKQGINSIQFSEEDNPLMVFELVRYYLSKGFDLFGLIESGLAIAKSSNP